MELIVSQNGPNMDRIRAAKAFIIIAEQGSFVTASEILNISRASASRCVAELEDWAQVKLLHRTTRRLSLTPAGERVLEHCRELVELAETISHTLSAGEKRPSGTLRISCSQYYAQYTLLDIIAHYQELYPDVRVELQISGHTVDLVKERIDIALRISNSLDPNLIARRFGDCPSTLCASPQYLKKSGSPLQLEDLKQHNCLSYSNFENTFWTFFKDGQKKTVTVSGDLGANESMLLLNAALKGKGITLQPSDAVASYITSGELVPLLTKFQPETLGVYGVFLTRKNMPPAQRAFIDLLVQHYRQGKSG